MPRDGPESENEHVNAMDDRLEKIAKNGKPSPGHLDGLQNVGAKVEHEYHRRIGWI